MNTTTSEKVISEAGLPAKSLTSSEICSDKVLTDEQRRPVEVRIYLRPSYSYPQLIFKTFLQIQILLLCFKN